MPSQSTASTLEVVGTGLYMDGEFLEDRQPAPFAATFEVLGEATTEGATHE